MSALPTRRRVVPSALMALGFGLAVAGSFGITPLSSADTGYDNGITTTTSPSGYETTTIPETTTTVPKTTTTVPETTTTVPQTTTTVPETTTTVPKTTTTVPETTTTAPKTTTTAPATTTTVVKPTTTVVSTSVSPATTVKKADTEALAVTGASTSVPMIGLGVSLFVIGLIILEMRANQANA